VVATLPFLICLTIHSIHLWRFRSAV